MINLIFFLEFLALALVLMLVTDTLPKTKKFIARKIKAHFRLYRLRNYRKSADRQIEVNRRHLAEKRAAMKAIVY